MKKIAVLLAVILLIMSFVLFKVNGAGNMESIDFEHQNAEQLKQQYLKIKQANLNKLNIKPEDIQPLIKAFGNNHTVTLEGYSYLKKPIYQITIGNGPIDVLMWSQMHGDEPTATASLFDLINYIDAKENQQWVSKWSNKITLHMVPMLNPDGADKDQRYNAQSIDINRDAKRLQTSEGRLLNRLADSIKPQYGFNLHDQGRFYSAGHTNNTATISVLAPAYNDAKDINESRGNAIKLIGILNHSLQQQIPNHVGRYDDTYSFRAFGDLLSSKGIATTLIESGHYPGDQTRQTARWMTFMMLVQSIDLIANDLISEQSMDGYHSLPMNQSNGVVDLILRNVNLAVEQPYHVDLAINFNSKFEKPRIREVGDLSAVVALEEYEMKDYQWVPARGFKLTHPFTLTTQSYTDLLRQGFGYFEGDKSLLIIKTQLPVAINPSSVPRMLPQRYQAATFLFKRDGKLQKALIKGKMINL